VAAQSGNANATPAGDVIVTGASGFLGQALLSRLSASRFARLRVLCHRRPVAQSPADYQMTTVTGNLLEPDIARTLVTPGATVIHLAHLTTERLKDDNLAAARNLAAACSDAGIARLVHCSTAVVVGNVPDDVVTEETPCCPLTGYERTKYRIEQEMREAAAGRHEMAILRPTSIFGPGGRNLVSLARRVLKESELANRAYSMLQGRRRMNLVSVHNVAAALSLLATTHHAIDQQIYICSDDEDPLNNFRDVEQILRHELSRERRVPAWSLPPSLLSAMLRVRGRSNANPERVHSDAKLRALGFAKPWAFDRAVSEFADWFRTRSGAADHHAGT
jgi:nucleoside-diphosphate-sugar epimerase